MTVNIDDAVCKHCHKVIATVPKNYCPRSPNHMHEPVESDTVETIDLTPVGMTTPEGIQRVNEASRASDAATRSFATACALFLDEYNLPLIEMVASEGVAHPSIRDDWHQIQALHGAYRRRQETFLRAVAGIDTTVREAQNNEGI